MNCLIVRPQEFVGPGAAVLRGERADHVLDLHRLQKGLTVKAAELGGRRGTATVEEVLPGEVRLMLTLNQEPLPRAPVDWIVGISRPPTMKKIAQVAATLGIGDVHLIRTSKTEKSYLQSPVFDAGVLELEAEKGLEQSGDSVLPRFSVHRFFRPFIEETLPLILREKPAARKILADTRAGDARLSQVREYAFLAIGPEAGWDERETLQFRTLGFDVISLGARHMRVETAAVYLTAFIAGGSTEAGI